MIDWTVLFKPPDECIPGLQGGTLARWGPIIRDVATGRWKMLMQETGSMSDAIQNRAMGGLGGGGGPVSMLLQGGQLASSIAANVQLRQLKAMLTGLSMMTAVSLAASLAGIGVSAAGFALVLRRLNQIEQTVVSVKNEVMAARLRVEKIDISIAARNWAQTESVLQLADQAWVRSSPEVIWRQLDIPLYQEQLYWRGLIEGKRGPSIFCDPRFTLTEVRAHSNRAFSVFWNLGTSLL